MLTKSGTPYKPSVLRGWQRDLDAYMLADLGSYRLSEIELDDFQQLVHRLAAKGLSATRTRGRRYS